MDIQLCSLLIHTFFYLTDPPAEMKLNTPSGVNENFFLKKGFGEYVLNASAQPYAAIDCSSVKITWVSPSKGNLRSCRAEGKKSVKSFKATFFFPIHIRCHNTLNCIELKSRV